MTKAQTMWTAVLVLAASCLAVAEQPVMWFPAQQAPDAQSSQAASGQAGQQPTTDTGQQPSTQSPTQQPGIQPVQPGGQPGAPAKDDPRLDQPLQPIAPAESSSTGTQPAPATAPMVADKTPLNTPQDLTLGTSGGGTRNYFIPSFRFTEYADKTTGVPGQGTMPVTNLVGTAQILHNWSWVQAALNYSAGGTIFPTNSDFNSTFHTFGVSMNFRIQRWTFTLNDSGSYTPESSFGYYATAGLSGGTINSGFLPNQSILTLNSPRISNTVALTIQRPMSARSSLHFSASYGVLRFQGGPFINSDDITYTAGYDHTIGARNTLGIAYIGNLSLFGGSDRSLATHGVNIAYGRRITGRLALQLSGGPEVRIIDDPLAGSDSAPSWNARAGVVYSISKTNLSSSFSRNATSGAGLLAGTESYVWQNSAARQIGRVWNGSLAVGFARNTTLPQALIAERHFNTEFVSLQIGRPLGRDVSLYVSYNFQHQSSTFPVCLGCEDTVDRHVIGMGFEWHSRPLNIGSF